MATGGVSVIVRARDEERSLERCLTLVAGQRGVGEPAELILVDGGSSDGTVAVAHRHGATVLNAGEPYSFGGALNLGASEARGAVLVALSAHAFPRDDGWLARLVAPFEDRHVACACGDSYGPDGELLTGPVAQDAALAARRPEWGYSNAAGAFRAELWRRRPFRGDLPACEDKEWAWEWLWRGYRCVVDPSLLVDHDHTHDRLRDIFRRARREARAYGSFLERPPYEPRDLVRDWWSDLRWYDSVLKARLSPRRATRLLGAYAGRRH
ncbi:MAG TPA: glycosyltransferase [Solirubrobacteraceae bacterium]|jgi:rhamnosyltransferase